MQELRNEEFREIKKKEKEEKMKKEIYVKGLTRQIERKKEQVYLSREEFKKDKEMVEGVVKRIIEEELR